MTMASMTMCVNVRNTGFVSNESAARSNSPRRANGLLWRRIQSRGDFHTFRLVSVQVGRSVVNAIC